jgi:hypothetical protein
MRNALAWLGLSAVVVACSDTVAEPPPLVALDAAVGDSGVAIGADAALPPKADGSTDGAVRADTGGLDANVVDPFSTDRKAFFGASRCAGSSFQFCDDFESKSAGDAPDAAAWELNFWNPANSSAKIEAAGARGGKSMRFEIGQGQGKAMMSLKRPFPIAGNAFWARMFLRMNNLPLPFKYNDTANFPLTHWTFAYATGNHVFPGNKTLRPELRAGGFINRVPLMNEDGMDRPEIGIDDKMPPMGQTEFPENQWACMELYWGGPTQEMRYFQDGVEHSSLHVTKTNTGGTNNSNPPWPMPEPFDTLTVGLVMYQAYDKVGPRISANIDEVAVDKDRIGCVR